MWDSIKAIKSKINQIAIASLLINSDFALIGSTEKAVVNVTVRLHRVNRDTINNLLLYLPTII